LTLFTQTFVSQPAIFVTAITYAFLYWCEM
jgi:hypothetical protein